MPHPLVKWSYEPPRAAGRARTRSRARSTSRRCRRAGPVFVSIPMDDWDAEVDEAPSRTRLARAGQRPRAAPDPARCATLAAAARGRRATRCWSPGRDIDAARRAGTPRSRWPSARGCRCGRSPATGGGRIGFPEGHPHFQGVLPPAIGPLGRDARGPRPRAGRRLVGVPLLPEHPRARCCPRAPRWWRSRATPTRPRARRWATRSSPTSRSRSRRCSPSSATPSTATRRPSRAPRPSRPRTATR